MPRHTATVCFLTTIGLTTVEAAPAGITRVHLNATGRPREVGGGEALQRARAAREEILAYLAGALRVFSVPVVVQGTPFQRGVWRELCRIPYGERRTYGVLAERLGRPRAARAIGAACGANPTPILIPCHRVVAGDGSLCGFGGGVTIKQALLELEAAHSRPG